MAITKFNIQSAKIIIAQFFPKRISPMQPGTFWAGNLTQILHFTRRNVSQIVYLTWQKVHSLRAHDPKHEPELLIDATECVEATVYFAIIQLSMIASQLRVI